MRALNGNDRRLAPYAVHDAATRGRAHPDSAAVEQGAAKGADPASGTSPFDLDRHRITACTAFRRLMHKTQVFIAGDTGDHFRTRLTHTLEVAAQAERLARLLRVNHRLAAAIALAHDLGHPPFGHAGEAALASLMDDRGGFEHNLQSLRVVDYLEHPYPEFRGLNLSFELRESLVKHQTRFDRPETAAADPSTRDLLATGPQPPLEGQIANLADAIAYTLHDIEDGIGEGQLREEALIQSSLWRSAAARVNRSGQNLHAVRRPILDRLADLLVADVAAESQRRIATAAPDSADALRSRPDGLVAFSAAMQTAVSELQGILMESVYRHHRVVRMDAKAGRLIRDLFCAYLAEPRLLPPRFARRVDAQGAHRVICDYIAGMTDRFCQQEHRRLFAPFHFD